jgi:double-stranded uracil-DNA glycosylase
VIAPGLTILFCGINPGLYSAAIGHNFGRPGNRFWPTLYAAGITPRLFSPAEERELLALGCGITNVATRATATADQLTREEIITGGKAMIAKVEHYQPRVLALLGVTTYRIAFARPQAQVGRQAERLGATWLWVLPNPSGLNAHYQVSQLAVLFRELKDFAFALP